MTTRLSSPLRHFRLERALALLLSGSLLGCHVPAVVGENAALERLRTRVREGDEVGIQYLATTAEGPFVEFGGGRLDVTGTRPVTPDSVFLSASTTKVLTAAAVLLLVQRGVVRLDQPLSDFVPEQPYGAAVTIRRLLNQSSGAPNPLPLRWVHPRTEPSFDETAALDQVLGEHGSTSFDPGTRYGYSNLSYWLLGRVVERASGRPYARFVEQELFAPLGIEPSELGFDVEHPERLARGHERRFSPVGLLVPLLTDESARSEPSGGWLRFADVTMNGPAYGGAFASARGYGKFLADLLRDEPRVLSPEAKRLFFASQWDSRGRELPTTLGWHRGALEGVPYFDKPGGGPGSSANVRVYPTLGFATVWLSNRMRTSEDSIRALSDELDAPIVNARRVAR